MVVRQQIQFFYPQSIFIGGKGASSPIKRDKELGGYISPYHGGSKEAKEPRDPDPKKKRLDTAEDVSGI